MLRETYSNACVSAQTPNVHRLKRETTEPQNRKSKNSSPEHPEQQGHTGKSLSYPGFQIFTSARDAGLAALSESLATHSVTCLKFS